MNKQRRRQNNNNNNNNNTEYLVHWPSDNGCTEGAKYYINSSFILRISFLSQLSKCLFTMKVSQIPNMEQRNQRCTFNYTILKCPVSIVLDISCSVATQVNPSECYFSVMSFHASEKYTG